MNTKKFDPQSRINILRYLHECIFNHGSIDMSSLGLVVKYNNTEYEVCSLEGATVAWFVLIPVGSTNNADAVSVETCKFADDILSVLYVAVMAKVSELLSFDHRWSLECSIVQAYIELRNGGSPEFDEDMKSHVENDFEDKAQTSVDLQQVFSYHHIGGVVSGMTVTSGDYEQLTPLGLYVNENEQLMVVYCEDGCEDDYDALHFDVVSAHNEKLSTRFLETLAEELIYREGGIFYKKQK